MRSAKPASAFGATSSTCTNGTRSYIEGLARDIGDETGQQLDSEEGRRFIEEAKDAVGLKAVPSSLLRAFLHTLAGNRTRTIQAVGEFAGEVARRGRRKLAAHRAKTKADR